MVMLGVMLWYSLTSTAMVSPSLLSGSVLTGKMVFYSSPDDQFVLMDLKTLKKEPLGIRGHRPALSPDSKKLAYIGRRDQLIVYHMDTGKELRFPSGDKAYSSPTFVSDTTVAYIVNGENGVQQIGLSPIDRFNERKWTGKMPKNIDVDPTIHWIPGTGEKTPFFILSSKEKKVKSLYFISSDSPRVIVTSDLENDRFRYPAVSPDGKTIAFVRGMPGSIWAVELTGENLRRLNQDGNWPTWSPDGKFIAYLTTSFIDHNSSAYGRMDAYITPNSRDLFLKKGIGIMQADGTQAMPLVDTEGTMLLTRTDTIAWR